MGTARLGRELRVLYLSAVQSPPATRRHRPLPHLPRPTVGAVQTELGLVVAYDDEADATQAGDPGTGGGTNAAARSRAPLAAPASW